MNWTDITANWSDSLNQLKSRFPLIDKSAIGAPPKSPDILAAHLARQHDLTPLEAEEELRDWAFIQGLARQAGELQAGELQAG